MHKWSFCCDCSLTMQLISWLNTVTLYTCVRVVGETDEEKRSRGSVQEKFVIVRKW